MAPDLSHAGCTRPAVRLHSILQPSLKGAYLTLGAAFISPIACLYIALFLSPGWLPRLIISYCAEAIPKLKEFKGRYGMP
ncbi:hypothetical protein FIBSPDRAFT_880330 [Athelia psychrophila]|uniref:Uncharacterized protein n=1 Tax=Athelia psychrophila TaxID=1759441 RepID=A0A167T139_9AGAM|nr:hypothetical protein FIBSPDRAFT_880330 [Fibularhizoctonia sp. CBS 109695]